MRWDFGCVSLPMKIPRWRLPVTTCTPILRKCVSILWTLRGYTTKTLFVGYRKYPCGVPLIRKSLICSRSASNVHLVPALSMYHSFMMRGCAVRISQTSRRIPITYTFMAKRYPLVTHILMCNKWPDPSMSRPTRVAQWR